MTNIQVSSILRNITFENIKTEPLYLQWEIWAYDTDNVGDLLSALETMTFNHDKATTHPSMVFWSTIYNMLEERIIYLYNQVN